MHDDKRGSFFFFQAEDGIRDYKVTGVQTCALPILAYEPLANGFGARGLSVRKLPVGHTSLKGARALRHALGREGLTADMVLVDRARDIRLAAYASLGTALVIVYCISTPRPPRD